MLSQEYLSLQFIRLNAPECWKCEGNDVVFLFLRTGSGVLAGSSRIPLLPGDVIVFNGGLTRSVTADRGQMTFSFFRATVEHFFPLFGCNEVSLLQLVTEGFKSPRRFPASSPLALESQKLLDGVPQELDLEHRGQLLRIVAGILSAEFKHVRPQSGSFMGIQEHMQRVLEKLSVQEMLSLSVGELAARLSCSRRHLNRLFHQHFGRSVAALKMEMRLLNAVSLLRDPASKVINVAEQCGFNHLGLFNSSFKRRFGVSPGQWRKASGEVQCAVEPATANNGECRLKATGLCPWMSTSPGADKQAHPGVQLQSRIPPKASFNHNAGWVWSSKAASIPAGAARSFPNEFTA